MKIIIIASVNILLLLTACSANTSLENTDQETAVETQPSIEAPEYTALLEDVTGGEASGEALAKFDTETNKYTLHVTFKNLPALENEDFYEGWIVRKNPTSVLSTGETEIKDGTHINVFTADEDLTDHDFYVLTLEPNDGDPAPDKHILEGTLTK